MKGNRAMDRNTIYAGVSVVLAGLLGFTWAQGRGALSADEPKPVVGEIAVVDMSKVFNAHKRLAARMDEVKRDNERDQEEAKAMIEAGKQLQQELGNHKQGSAEFNRIQKEIQQKGVELQRFNREMQARFAQAQAQAYLETYQSVAEEVQRIAETRGFKLVLNYSSEPIDAKDLSKTMQVLSRQVLFQSGLDITDDVLQAVN
jgi:Skp family chaperone for outer membrane proteins